MSRNVLSRLCTVVVLLVMRSKICFTAQRPFYIIGHMVNSKEQVPHYLKLGANVIESDIQFFSNGTVDKVYHGFPCDCFRTCSRSVKLPDYLEYVRRITDPATPNNFADQMIMQFFDLKLDYVNNKLRAGEEIARHIMDHMWDKDDTKRPRLRALVYVNSVNDIDAIKGVLKEFTARNAEDMLKDVGFDGGVGDLEEIKRMFEYVGIESNIWQGDGKSNCFSALYPDGRLRKAVVLRDSRRTSVDKVYHWTIDVKIRMRLSLNLGIDGMITNDPHDIVDVLKEHGYRNEYRIATPKDNPFERFVDSK